MIKNKIIKIIMISIILLVAIGSTVCYATDMNFSDYKPQIAGGGSAMGMFNGLLNVLIVLGVVSVAVAIALIGFNSILGSASEKADMQQKLVGIVMAALMISGGSIIAKFIISFAISI